MPNFIAQVIHHGTTGLPTDRFVNTLHFSGTDTLEDSAPLIANRLNEFYGDVTIAGGTVWSKYSNGIDTAEVRVYDMGDAEPRVPVIIPMEAMNARSSPTDLPREVALTLSIHGVPPVTARRRGRLFLGPFNDAVCAGTGIPFDAYLQDVTRSAQRMADENTVDLEWVIYSPTTGLFTIVTAGFCDNAFDTIRSRGLGPTDRRTFPYPP